MTTCSYCLVGVALTLAPHAIASAQVPEVKDPPAIVTASRSCAVPAGPPASSAAIEPRIPVAAWILGAREGELASWNKQVLEGEAMRAQPGMDSWIATSRKQASAAAASAERMAVVLKVNRPQPFKAVRGNAAFDELYKFVEADSQPTARGLATAYGPWVCDVYKLAVYWGFSIPYRIGVRNTANVFAQEIRFYGSRVALPNELLNRMTAGVPKPPTDQRAFADSQEISRVVAEYWSTQRRSARGR